MCPVICPFCIPPTTPLIIVQNEIAFAIPDKFPVTKGHTLIAPYRHSSDYFSMSRQERKACEDLILVLKNKMIAEDASVTGFNIGMNCGETAGQTVMHAHIHLIPRRHDDTSEPEGGVRGVIPAQMKYPKTF